MLQNMRNPENPKFVASIAGTNVSPNVMPLVRKELARKAAALEKKLNPGAVGARRERARQRDQRVEVRPELSGNASLSGREMDTVDVLASKVNA